MEKYLSISLLLVPLGTFLFLFENGSSKKYAGIFATLLCLVSLVTSTALLFLPDFYISFTWLHTGEHNLDIAIRVDKTAKIMAHLVSFISLMVNIYSIVYMKGEKHYHKYFAYIGLFTFSMLGIVVFDNLLFIYGFWELVGLSSYLLIGFWYQNPQATMASKKAFIINRIGDIGFLVGILMIWSKYGTLDLSILLKNPLAFDITDTLIGISLFGGCVGKSAQFPLQVWLPDAMQGPTPASALIHAATMVAAGIYFMIRITPLCTPDVFILMGLIGSITCFFAAITACFQTDIKKILAYSTISQLGYMVVALSTGNSEVAYLHLCTHAFFKAGLFLCAGAIIHEVSHHHFKINGKIIDPQDIRNMGGLKKHMRLTYYAYILCYASAVGLPFTSGFISKDYILSNLLEKHAQSSHLAYLFIFLLASATVLITAYYMTRQLILVFLGNSRLVNTDDQLLKDPQKSMVIPPFLLGIFSLFVFFSFDPFDASNAYIFEYLEVKRLHNMFTHSHEIALFISFTLTAMGITLAYYFNVKIAQKSPVGHTDLFKNMAYQHFYLNKLYMRVLLPINMKGSKLIHKIDEKLIDYTIDKFGVANVITAHVLKIIDQYAVDGIYKSVAYLGKFLGNIGMDFQSGKIQNYLKLTLILLSMIIILYLFIW